MALPHATTGSLCPAFAPARHVCLTVKLPYAIALKSLISIQAEGTFGRLRYLLGGDRPSQTACLPWSGHRITVPVRSKIQKGWYSKVDSTRASARASQSPSYPLHPEPLTSGKLQ